jgi:hypothetical protein
MSDLLSDPSMRCAIGEHERCLFADAGCPCACHRATHCYHGTTAFDEDCYLDG